MTPLLEQALGRAEREADALPVDRQDHLAAVILGAIDDLEWDRQFAGSLDVLRMLEAEGLADLEAGRTRRLKG